MGWISGGRLALGAVAVSAVLGAAQTAQAQDFFSALFGGLSGGASRGAPADVPLFGDGPSERGEARPRRSGGGGQAFCVRTCDGRYFPIAAGDAQTRAASCNNFCPSAETKVVYGSNIDQAATAEGKQYSELPNAFVYRTKMVAGCTCNGKDQVGLSPVKIETDPTLRKGDIVAGAEGLMVSHNSADKRGTTISMSPASEAVRAKYERPDPSND